MKKTLCLLIAAALSVSVILTSCGSSSDGGADDNNQSASQPVADVSADALLDAAVAAYSADELPSVKYYRSSVTDADGDAYLDPDYAGLLFLGEFGADTGVLTRLDSYALCVPQSKNAFEIDIFKLADEADAAEAKTLLESRFSRKDNGEIETYVPEELPILKGVEYYVKGRYVAMICTPDNSKAISAIDAMLG